MMRRFVLASVACAHIANAQPPLEVSVGGGGVVASGDWGALTGIGGCLMGQIDYVPRPELTWIGRVGSCAHSSRGVDATVRTASGEHVPPLDARTQELLWLAGASFRTGRFAGYALTGLNVFGLKLRQGSTDVVDQLAVGIPLWIGGTFRATDRLDIDAGVFSPDVVFGGMRSIVTALGNQPPDRLSIGVIVAVRYTVWKPNRPAPSPPESPPVLPPVPPPAPAQPPPTTTAAATEIRGVVRAEGSGAAVAARISIEPGGYQSTSAADGSFALPVAPGTYTVTVRADGFTSQILKTNVKVSEVSILNVDLYRQ